LRPTFALASAVPASPAPAVAIEPLDARISAEEMVERAVLEEQHDDVIDRRARAVDRLAVSWSARGARGEDEPDQHHADEPWTTTAHAVF